MPPPQVVCVKCRHTVLKAQTYHIGGGQRACKTHLGVVETKEQLQQKLAQQKLAERQAAEAREARWQQRLKEQVPSYWAQPRCWCCHVRGIHEQDFYTGILVYSELQQLKGSWLNPFAPDYPSRIRAIFKLREGEDLNVICIFPLEDSHHPILKVLDFNSRQCVQMSGLVALCPKCAQTHKVEKPPMPMPSLETAMTIYDLVSPIFKRAASKALAEEAKHN